MQHWWRRISWYDEDEDIDVVDEDATFDIIPYRANNQNYNVGLIKIPSFYINFEEAQRGMKDYKSVTRDVKRCIDSLKALSVDEYRQKTSM